MLAQRCMGWRLTSLGKSHLNSLPDMSNAFSCTKKRRTIEEANEQIFKGDFWMAQRLRNGVVFLQGHDGEFTFMVKHGLLMGTSEAPRIFSKSFDKTFKRWKVGHQTPFSLRLSAPFAGMKGMTVDGSRSGFADDLFIKGEVPEHTAESAKDIIIVNTESLDAALAEDRYKQNLRKLEIVLSLRRYGERRRLTALIPYGKVLGRARHLGGRYAFNWSNKAEIECRLQAMAANWAALRGLWFARSPWSHRRQIFMSRIGSAAITGLDAYAASPGELNRLDKKVCRYLRALSKGKAHEIASNERHGRS